MTCFWRRSEGPSRTCHYSNFFSLRDSSCQVAIFWGSMTWTLSGAPCDGKRPWWLPWPLFQPYNPKARSGHWCVRCGVSVETCLCLFHTLAWLEGDQGEGLLFRLLLSLDFHMLADCRSNGTKCCPWRNRSLVSLPEQQLWQHYQPYWENTPSSLVAEVFCVRHLTSEWSEQGVRDGCYVMSSTFLCEVSFYCFCRATDLPVKMAPNHWSIRACNVFFFLSNCSVRLYLMTSFFFPHQSEGTLYVFLSEQ